MWDGLFVLLLLCFVMAGASFLAGILPLSLSLSSRQLRLITALGTGVLVGTSLIVIIPEGVETLYSSSAETDGHGHVERSVATIMTRGEATFETTPVSYDTWRRDAIPWAQEIDLPTGSDSSSDFRTGPDDGYDIADGEDLQSPPSSEPDVDGNMPSDSHPSPSHHEPHAWVGVSLIFGFVLMYLIDTLPQVLSARNTSAQPQRFPISLNQFSINNRSDSTGQLDDEEEPPTPSLDPSSQHSTASRPSSTTVGLVIHAAADGIALGASSASSSGKRNLTFIIFLALMIHKAPAAFGLTSVLLKQGLSKRRARAHLIIFALAAPVGALLTWSGAHILGYSSTGGEDSDTTFATGVLLLFSAGTFLYVAMHTMQEGSSSHSHGEDGGHGYAEMNGHGSGVYGAGPSSASKLGSASVQPPRLLETMVTVAGMLLPLLTQFGHAH